MATPLTARLCRYLERHRVGHLATADAKGRPHLVPVVFAVTGGAVVVVIDEKPKRARGSAVKRVRNILANPQVAFLVDDYDEDWRRLAYALVRGRAEIVARSGVRYKQAVARLRARYPQYRTMPLTPVRNPLIRIVPEHVHEWSASGAVGAT